MEKAQAAAEAAQAAVKAATAEVDRAQAAITAARVEKAQAAAEAAQAAVTTAEAEVQQASEAQAATAAGEDKVFLALKEQWSKSDKLKKRGVRMLDMLKAFYDEMMAQTPPTTDKERWLELLAAYGKVDVEHPGEIIKSYGAAKHLLARLQKGPVEEMFQNSGWLPKKK